MWKVALNSSTHGNLQLNVLTMPYNNKVLLFDHSLNWMLTFEWFMARFVVRIGRKKDMCYDESGVCA